MRYILLVLFAFVTTFASAQVQYLGSPTTTVRNRGNFVSDSLFYLPKRQKLPSDTGAMRYQISDSALYVWTGSAWRSTGTAGSAITGSGVAGYMPEFTTSTNLDTTRLYHSAGRFAIGSTTTTNGVFNVYSGQSYFDTSLKVGSQTLLADEGKNEVYVNTTTDAGAFTLQMDGNANFNASTAEALRLRGGSGFGLYQAFRNTTLFPLFIGFGSELNSNATINDAVLRYSGSNNFLISGDATERARFNGAGEFLINTTTDAGAYALQVAGAIYNTTGAVLAASSGNVGIGTASPSTKLHVYTDASNESRIRGGSMTLNAFRISSALSDFEDNAGLVINTTANDGYKVGISMTSQYFGAIQSYNTQGSPTVARNLTLNPYGGEVLIGTTTDAGAYALQVAGSIYNTTGYWTGSSGQLGIGVTSSSYPMEIIKDGNSIGIGNSIISIRGSGGDDQRLHFGYNGTNVSLIAAARTLAFTRYDLVADGWRESMRINNTGELLIGTTTDAGAYALQVTGAIYNTTTITTGAPSGGTAKPFKIGAAATVSPTSPNRTIEIEIDGTTYYLHAKTTND